MSETDRFKFYVDPFGGAANFAPERELVPAGQKAKTTLEINGNGLGVFTDMSMDGKDAEKVMDGADVMNEGGATPEGGFPNGAFELPEVPVDPSEADTQPAKPIITGPSVNSEVIKAQQMVEKAKAEHGDWRENLPTQPEPSRTNPVTDAEKAAMRAANLTAYGGAEGVNRDTLLSELEQAKIDNRNLGGDADRAKLRKAADRIITGEPGKAGPNTVKASIEAVRKL